MCLKFEKLYFPEKVCLSTLCGPKISQTYPPCYVALMQIIDGKNIFSNSLAKLANLVPDRKVDKHTSPSRGGLPADIF